MNRLQKHKSNLLGKNMMKIWRNFKIATNNKQITSI